MASAAEEVLFVNFNQDATSLAIGTRKGYRLYGLLNVDSLVLVHEADVEDTCLIERLFSSSLVTLVSLTAPRKLRVCHFQKGTEICSHSYANTILSVRLNRLRVVVCLEESLFVHNIRDMKVLHTIRDTPPNPHGLSDLTAADVSYLAYPGSSHIGEIQIFDAANLQAVSMISAHDSPLAAMKFNSDGSKIATASEKGTVIRVFGIPTGEKLFEFRRGVKRCVTINSLAFSADSLFLCSSSNTETVHIFKLDPHQKQQDKDGIKTTSDDENVKTSTGWMDYVSKTAATYLPTQMTDIFQQDRSFATAKLPSYGSRPVLALTLVKHILRLMVASADGYLYIYNVDKANGGECTLAKQHKFTGLSTIVGGASVGQSPTGKSYAEQHLENEVASSRPSGEGLRLDDSREFPPMSHMAD